MTLHPIPDKHRSCSRSPVLSLYLPISFSLSFSWCCPSKLWPKRLCSSIKLSACPSVKLCTTPRCPLSVLHPCPTVYWHTHTLQTVREGGMREGQLGLHWRHMLRLVNCATVRTWNMASQRKQIEINENDQLVWVVGSLKRTHMIAGERWKEERRKKFSWNRT